MLGNVIARACARRAHGGRAGRRRECVAALATICAALGLTAPAQALTFEPGSFTTTLSSTQAGGHPDLTTAFTVALDEAGNLSGTLRDIDVDLPAGLVGDPGVTPRCTYNRVVTGGQAGVPPCPIASAVGVVRNRIWSSEFREEAALPARAVYNITPKPGSPAAFAFSAVFFTVRMDVFVRSDGDYGLRASVRGLTEGSPIKRTELTLWGVPADNQGPPGDEDPVYFDPVSGDVFGGPDPTAARRAFLSNPGRCDGQPLRATLRVRSWQEPSDWQTSTTGAPPMEGCDALSFAPTIAVETDTRAAGAPAGLRVDLAVPQRGGAVLATPALKDVIVALPEGMAISPSAADGLAACSDEQLGIGSAATERCSDSSKLGSVKIDTPLLPEPLEGGIYMGTQQSLDPRSGEMVRIFLTAYGSGVRVKLRGAIELDPSTGRLTARFLDNPQLPFSLLSLRFKGGPRAPLSNPRTCGTGQAEAQLTAWSGHRAAATSPLTIDGGCGAHGFSPTFLAGTANPVGGADSPFTLTVGREDGDQMLSTVTVDMPQGLLARIAGVAALCADGPAASGTCDEAARVGSVSVAAGPGTQPFRLPGRAYLAGPYRGAPFSLSIVVPAIAGPLDLGTVVVRAAVHIDRRTTALRVVADPMPWILAGVPLQIRQVTVAIDRPRFTVNPTSCSPTRVGGVISSLVGAVATVASRFQVGGCAALPFRPRMVIRAGGKGRTSAGITTPLEVTLRMGHGDANNRSVQVTLPPNLNSRLRVINDACSLGEFQAGAGSCRQVGTAVAQTPLLRDPLLGRVYFVRNPARRLPDLMVALKGQGVAERVEVDLTGRVTIPRSLSLRTTFDTIPDVPISRFTLRLVAGRRGAVGFVRSACERGSRRQRAAIVYHAQNARTVRVGQRLRIAGCGRR